MPASRMAGEKWKTDGFLIMLFKLNTPFADAFDGFAGTARGRYRGGVLNCQVR